MSERIDDYTPQMVQDGPGAIVYATFLVELWRCPLCRTPMLSTSARVGVFPAFWRQTVGEQVYRAGFHWRSTLTDKHGETICQNCADAGLSSFICALCGKERRSDGSQCSFGEPPEYLCKLCYTTVSAKLWDAKATELQEAHRYDCE